MKQMQKLNWPVSRRTILAGVALAAASLIAFGGGYLVGQKTPLPPPDIDTQTAAYLRSTAVSSWESDIDRQPPTPITRVVAVERGDNLMGVLLRAGAERGDAHAAIQSLNGSYDPRRDLNIGDQLQITFGPGESPDSPKPADGVANGGYVLARLKLPISYDRELEVARQTTGGFVANEVERPLERELFAAAGKIDSSLFVAATEAGVPPGVLAELIRIYSFDIDFQREVWPGDRFELMYERFRDRNGEIVHDGSIQYAKLTVRSTELPLYRFVTRAGNLDYFNVKGESVRKALMRTPIDGARLSSRFGRRKHPILGYTRLHAGIDFAAPRGTPIYAAGNGRIVQAGRNGGYGKYIRIRHNDTFQTAYAHMNGFARGVRQGRRVRQGQVIGYVGSTGRSTGPHLHYEILRKGRQINPQTLRLPSGEKLKGSELERFAAHHDALDREFALLLRDAVRVAGHEAGEDCADAAADAGEGAAACNVTD